MKVCARAGCLLLGGLLLNGNVAAQAKLPEFDCPPAKALVEKRMKVGVFLPTVLKSLAVVYFGMSGLVQTKYP